MKYLSDKEYKRKMANLKKKNDIAKKKNDLKKEKRKYKKKISTSKFLLLVVIILCLEIIVFSQYVMIKFQDLTALYTLIGVPVTIVPVALGYYYKSLKENTENGIVYQTALHQMEVEDQMLQDSETNNDEVSAVEVKEYEYT